MKGLELINEYKKGIHNWFPMVDHIYKTFPERNEFGDVNIGWNAILLGNIPCFIEVWATDGFTILSAFIYAHDKNHLPCDEITKMLVEEGVFKLSDNYLKPETRLFIDSHNNPFYSYNIVIGDEDNTYVTAVKCLPYELLNVGINRITYE